MPFVRVQRAVVLAIVFMLGSCSLMSNAQSFDPSNVPPLPDYSRPDAWLAFPGRPGLEHAAPTGEAPVNDHLARVDVFFIHPTTVMGGGITNARYDAVAPFNAAVLVQQVSVFNSCCRLFAPQYRQATLRALNDDQAVELAYSDVLRAFRYYIAHENHGRPFIIASHSQGTTHAVRLLQEAIRHAFAKQNGGSVSDRRIRSRQLRRPGLADLR